MVENGWKEREWGRERGGVLVKTYMVLAGILGYFHSGVHRRHHHHHQMAA